MSQREPRGAYRSKLFLTYPTSKGKILSDLPLGSASGFARRYRQGAALLMLVMSLIKRMPLKRAIFNKYHRLWKSGGNIHTGRAYFGAELECNIEDFIQRIIFTLVSGSRLYR